MKYIGLHVALAFHYFPFNPPLNSRTQEKLMYFLSFSDRRESQQWWSDVNTSSQFLSHSFLQQNFDQTQLFFISLLIYFSRTLFSFLTSLDILNKITIFFNLRLVQQFILLNSLCNLRNLTSIYQGWHWSLPDLHWYLVIKADTPNVHMTKDKGSVANAADSRQCPLE